MGKPVVYQAMKLQKSRIKQTKKKINININNLTKSLIDI